MLGIQGTPHPARTRAGHEQGLSRGAPEGLCLSGKLAGTLRSAPKTITAWDRPVINRVSVQRVCSWPLNQTLQVLLCP